MLFVAGSHVLIRSLGYLASCSLTSTSALRNASSARWICSLARARSSALVIPDILSYSPSRFPTITGVEFTWLVRAMVEKSGVHSRLASAAQHKQYSASYKWYLVRVRVRVRVRVKVGLGLGLGLRLGSGSGLG